MIKIKWYNKKRQGGITRFMKQQTVSRNCETNHETMRDSKQDSKRKINMKKRQSAVTEDIAGKYVPIGVQTSLSAYFQKPQKGKRRKFNGKNELLTPYSLPRPPENNNGK